MESGRVLAVEELYLMFISVSIRGFAITYYINLPWTLTLS